MQMQDASGNVASHAYDGLERDIDARALLWSKQCLQASVTSIRRHETEWPAAGTDEFDQVWVVAHQLHHRRFSFELFDQHLVFLFEILQLFDCH